MQPRLLDCKTVYAEFGIAPDKLRRLMRLGLVPSVRLGRRVFIDRVQFETFIRSGGRSLSENTPQQLERVGTNRE
jgi:hypothetical protein